MRRPDPPEEFTRILRESFSELQTEAQIAPLDLKFAPEVTQTLEEFTQKHFLDPAKSQIPQIFRRWVIGGTQGRVRRRLRLQNKRTSGDLRCASFVAGLD